MSACRFQIQAKGSVSRLHMYHHYYHMLFYGSYTYTKVGGAYFRESFGSTSAICSIRVSQKYTLVSMEMH
jgi:hypothetical protein